MIIEEPIKIKETTIKNRLVMPPMATSKALENGEISQDILDYYKEKSDGGYIGLIITEHSYVSDEGKASHNQTSISRDSDIEGFKKLAQIIHDNKSKVIAQINHAGGATSKSISGKDVFGASDIKMEKFKESPIKMEKEDIKKVISDFVRAAKRVYKAGFDGVEIHSAHGYLLNQFYSPLTNNREDEYCSSSIEDRLRIHIEIIQAIKKEVSNDFIIALRLGGSDYMENGTRISDSIKAVKILENVGLDLLDISGGFCGASYKGAKGQGYFSEITSEIKKVVNIPVILTGGIVDVEAANKLLEENKADLIGVGRAIFKDSLWAKKALGK